MLNKISILIPYKPDGGFRDHSFEWVRQFYTKTMPEAEIIIGKSDNDGLFNKSRAINTAAKEASRDIFVIADSDIFINPAAILKGINDLEQYPLVFPFNKILNISQRFTKDLIKKTPNWPIEIESYQYEIASVGDLGKLNIVTRNAFEHVSGFDERFKGWGGEDDAFFCSIETLLGKTKRYSNNLFHLWHPPLTFDQNPNGQFNLQLRDRYYNLMGDKDGMNKLISEKNHY